MVTLGADYGSRRGHGERALWSAVVQQAIDDVHDEPMGSIEYTDAVAFWSHAGDWTRARSGIADELGIHADDLAATGRRIIAQRRVSEGLTAETPVALPKPARRGRAHPPSSEFRFDASRPLPSERRRR